MRSYYSNPYAIHYQEYIIPDYDYLYYSEYDDEYDNDGYTSMTTSEYDVDNPYESDTDTIDYDITEKRSMEVINKISYVSSFIPNIGSLFRSVVIIATTGTLIGIGWYSYSAY